MEAFSKEVTNVYERIQPYVYRTPLLESPFLSKLTQGARVLIKLESEQVTGSFKVRGALSKLLHLRDTDPTVKQQGIITASSGNHALACNYASQKLGVPVVTYVSCDIDGSKESHLREAGIKLIKHGNDCMDAEVAARQAAQKEGKQYASPYNDHYVMLGQGTIGLEVLSDCPDVDCVLVSVGGGGLIAGIAMYMKAHKPSIKIVGCQPVESKVMYESVRAGSIVYEESGDTLSDGTKGGVEEGSMTFPPCRDLVDEWILVGEEDIAKAVYFMLDTHHKVVEGAAGVAIGAYMTNSARFAGQTVVLLSCGSSIGVPILQTIIGKYRTDAS